MRLKKGWKFFVLMMAVLSLAGMLGLSSCGAFSAGKLGDGTENGDQTEIEDKESGDRKTETDRLEEEQAGTIAEDDIKDVTESAKEGETEVVKTNGHVVGIDPGHQGSWVDMSEQEPDAPGSSNYKAKATAGTTGRFTGVAEYELNLDISLALRDELVKRGYRVVLTREDNDTAISNSERAIKAAEEGSEIYVRIHANGSDDSSVSGALGMTPSPSNPYVGQLSEDSYRLTESILNAYCEATGFGNLGIQYHDNMTGINWSSIPVTILEMGFMTNESDDTLMQDKAMQEKMVQGIADGIDKYFS
ncbi:MAG: N-acetylmuramoyl-L-alanine amidase [Lachnospiraceae bacterium]|nr:N-acetylmuramoyl-L-alanine amidase [Lachnospiraceae bacterium]